MRGVHLGHFGALTALLAMSGAAQATLIDRGGGLIYDDVLDITWTQNANIGGLDTWASQVAWADSLSVFDSVRGVTWSDWRLPSVDANGDDAIVDCSSAPELDCRDNEYGYLFHQYGIRSGMPGPFTDVQSSDYWAGTEFRPNPFGAWVFRFFGGGSQAGGDRNDDNFAWAVRDGDVAAGTGDTDGDGVDDVADNCIEIVNADQRDTDGDGYGNVCDADLNNDCTTDFLDLGMLKAAFFGTDADSDLNGDGTVDFLDLGLMKATFFGPPGPSADSSACGS